MIAAAPTLDALSVLAGARTWSIDCLDVRAGLSRLPADSIHAVVTSPPYWNLRDYGVEGQLGLEATPAEYIANQVAVFEEVRRILRPDGTLWLNIGDSYSASGKGGNQTPGKQPTNAGSNAQPHRSPPNGFKLKDLVGIPWLLAFALRDAGWYLRSDCLWSKPNPMPESCKDRPTKSHEYLFLLSKSERYFYDWFAGAEPVTQTSIDRDGVDRRNARTVWTIPVQGYKGQHFATMPAELVRQCLRLSASERGVCPECGAPWFRRLKRERIATRPAKHSKVNVPRIPKGWAQGPGSHRTLNHNTREGNERQNGTIVGNRDPERHIARYSHDRWEAACACGLEQTAPAVILDPYGGAGTTPLVARKMGFRAIAFELNPKYAHQARRRITADAPLFNQEP